MTNDMQSSFGIVDDGSTDKTIKKVEQFDKSIAQTEGTINSLSDAFLRFEKQADGTFKAMEAVTKQPVPQPSDDGGGGGGRFGVSSRAIGQVGRQLSQLGGEAKIAGVSVSEVGSSVSSLAMASGPAAIALAAFTIGIKLYQDQLDEANEEFTRSQGVIEEVARVTAQGTDAAADRIAAAEAEIAIQEQVLASAEATSQAASEAGGSMDSFTRGAETVAGWFTTDLEETADSAAETAAATIASEQEVIDSLENEFGPALDNAGSSAKQAADEAEKAAEAMQQLAEQEANLRTKRKQSLDDLAFDRARRDSRAAEDDAEAAVQRADQSAEAARRDIANVTKIRNDGIAQQAKTLKAANDDIIKTIVDGGKERVKLRQEFTDRAIEDQNRFNLLRIQANQDFRNSQFDAEQDNDIISALRAARAFDEQKIADENAAKKEAQQREDEKRERLQQLRDEQQQRTAEIRANLAIEIAAQKEALQSRLADAANATAERQRQEAKSEKANAKARAKRQRRQAEDDALADERSERAFQEQLKAIDDKRMAEQQALGAVFGTLQAGGVATVGAMAQATTTAINSMGQVTQQFVNQMANAANRGGGRIPAFAEGGIVTRPTIALIGEAGPEAIVPLGADGNSGGFGGGQPINIYLTTADIATGEQVGRAIQGAMGQMAQVDIQVLADSLAGVTQ